MLAIVIITRDTKGIVEEQFEKGLDVEIEIQRCLKIKREFPKHCYCL